MKIVTYTNYIQIHSTNSILKLINKSNFQQKQNMLILQKILKTWKLMIDNFLLKN